MWALNDSALLVLARMTKTPAQLLYWNYFGEQKLATADATHLLLYVLMTLVTEKLLETVTDSSCPP